jgi:isopentenyl phosphate kinase
MSTSSDLLMVKLGGSLITDKRGEAKARVDVIERLAGELAAARAAMTEDVLLGHGSGSFGHLAAARHGLGRGLRHAGGEAPPIAASATQDAAARLHRIVVDALVRAGVPAFSVAPSSAFLADGGRLVRGFIEPLEAALGEGLVPVVYGDVVADRSLGVSICSTENALEYLVRRLRRRGRRVRRVLWLGETAGVYDRQGRTVPRVDAASYRDVRRLIGAPAGTDVTGGMLLRLATARSLARLGVESWIFDGRRSGALESALLGREVAATRVVAQAS